jgi:predicted metal-dependent HD superfamily phosphohydrolase
MAARYAESHRRYHDSAHVRAVVRDAAVLAAGLRLPADERAVLTIAAGAHDVVYDGHPGDDERRSAS